MLLYDRLPEIYFWTVTDGIGRFRTALDGFGRPLVAPLVGAICREVTLALGDNERSYVFHPFRSGAFCLTKKSAGQRDGQYDISVGHFCISDRTLTVTDCLYSGLH